MEFSLLLSNYLLSQDKDDFSNLFKSLNASFDSLLEEDRILLKVTLSIALDWHLPYESILVLICFFYGRNTSSSELEKSRFFEARISARARRLEIFDKYSVSTDPESLNKITRTHKLRQLFYVAYVDTQLSLLALSIHIARMQQLQHLDITQRTTLCEENDAVYIPLLEMLGCWNLRIQISELGLPILHSAKILNNTALTKEKILPETSKYYSEIQESLTTLLLKEGIEASVKPHPHSNLNIYRKIRDRTTLNDLLLQVRVDIVVKSPSECYQALGLIHRKWGQVQGSPSAGGYFRDLIGAPKFTGYSCLITKTIYTSAKLPPRIIDIRLMTAKMEQVNSNGVLYPYLFGDDTCIENAWWQDNNLREFLQNNPIGSTGTSVYVFSPAGRVYQGLPNESTAIDYGYKIHSEIGNHAKRIWVNGQPTQYSQKLINGDLVEIALDPEYQGPDAKWLGVVKSSTATKRIKAELKKHAPHKGRQILDKVFANEIGHYMLGNSVSNAEFQSFLEEIAAQLGYSGLNALYFDITSSSSSPLENDKKISAERIVAKFIEKKLTPYIVRKDGEPIIPLEQIHLAHCNEGKIERRVSPGANIVGRIYKAKTKYERLIVHHADCPHVQNTPKVIQLDWIDNLKLHQPAKIEIRAVDQIGLLRQILDVIHSGHEKAIYLLGVKARVSRDREAYIQLTIEAESLGEIENLVSDLNKIKDSGIIHEIKVNALSPLEKILLREPDSLPNPYTVHAVSDARLFKGRDNEIQNILSTIRSSQNLLILYGTNRVGKTSLLNYFCNSVAREYKLLPVFIDIQRIPDQNEEGFWLELTKAVTAALSTNFRVRNIQHSKTRRESTNYEFFLNWLSDINNALQGWKVIIAIDELSVIDELWNPTEAKRLGSRLKAMVESENNVKFILCVQQTYYLRSLVKSEGLGPATWPLLRTGITMQLDFLDEGAARKLIREPMGQMLHFEDAAVERIIFLTSSHPYYLQNFLHEIVNLLNAQHENNVTLDIVESISQHILRKELLFYNLRQEYEGFRRYVLSAMASIGGEDNRSMSAKDIQAVMQRIGIDTIMRGLIATLEELRDRGVIERDDTSIPSRYAFRVPLFCLWLVKNKPLHLIFAAKERKHHGVK